MPHTIDVPGSLAKGYAVQIIDDLLASRAVPSSAASQAIADGWRVLVIVSPANPAEERTDFSPCERDCLDLLAIATRPLSAAKIRDALEESDRIHALVTVERAMTRLRRVGIVSNSGKRPRGYFLPERLPLLRLRPAA